jgi:hypothetical protein
MMIRGCHSPALSKPTVGFTLWRDSDLNSTSPIGRATTHIGTRRPESHMLPELVGQGVMMVFAKFWPKSNSVMFVCTVPNSLFPASDLVPAFRQRCHLVIKWIPFRS